MLPPIGSSHLPGGKVNADGCTSCATASGEQTVTTRLPKNRIRISLPTVKGERRRSVSYRISRHGGEEASRIRHAKDRSVVDLTDADKTTIHRDRLASSSLRSPTSDTHTTSKQTTERSGRSDPEEAGRIVMTSGKPKLVKSVHFAPDVKYVCRESRHKYARRYHPVVCAPSSCSFVGETEQLPAVVEKYMIRSLPAVSAVGPTSTEDSTNVIYVDSIGQICKRPTEKGVFASGREMKTWDQTSGFQDGETYQEKCDDGTITVRLPEIRDDLAKYSSSADDDQSGGRTEREAELARSRGLALPHIEKPTNQRAGKLGQRRGTSNYNSPPQMVFSIKRNTRASRRQSRDGRGGDVKRPGYAVSFYAA